MKNLIYIHIFFLTLLFLPSCIGEKKESISGLKIAVMADVHIQEIYGVFSDTDAVLSVNPVNQRNATIHTMERQLSISRLENEPYFAFLAALDDVVKRGVRYVILPGDFTSEGKVMNVRAVRDILKTYTEEHGLRFFLISGNHDPRYPYLADGGYPHFMGEGGRPQAVMSREGIYTPADPDHLPVIITKDIQSAGYNEVTSMLKDYGFFPHEEFIYWETPFSSYGLNGYSYETALRESNLENRMYEIQPHSMKVPDVSYLVEPVKGLWLLAIDANVYIPRNDVSGNPEDGLNFNQAGGGGFNALVRHKGFVVDWIRSVAERAEKEGKVLITYSHYPLSDLTKGASEKIRELLDRSHLHTIPREEVSTMIADAGIRIHFGGHVHMNYTGIVRTDKGNSLVDIQVPSLASYVPAYKLLTLRDKDLVMIETIVVDSVPRLDEFFDLYRQEHAYLTKKYGPDKVWDAGILSSGNYREFTAWHLRELTYRYRYLPQHWPEDLISWLAGLTGQDMLVISQMDHLDFSVPLKHGRNIKALIPKDQWQKASEKAQQMARVNGLSFQAFTEWTGLDLVYDYYRLNVGHELAFPDVGNFRMQQYAVLHALFSQGKTSLTDGGETSDMKYVAARLGNIFHILDLFTDGHPSVNFMVKLKTGEVYRMDN